MPVIAAVLVTAACGGASAPKVPGEEAVVLSDAAPPAGYEALRELAVTSGKGCGLLGQPGSADGARAEMRRAAKKLGATYVQVSQAVKPPVNHQCMEHAHELRGVAYRKTEPSAATSAPTTSTAGGGAPATAPATPNAGAPTTVGGSPHASE